MGRFHGVHVVKEIDGKIEAGKEEGDFGFKYLVLVLYLKLARQVGTPLHTIRKQRLKFQCTKNSSDFKSNLFHSSHDVQFHSLQPSHNCAWSRGWIRLL